MTKPQKKHDEILICGLRAVLLCAEKFPSLMIRLYYSKEQSSSLKTVLKLLAQKKLAYHEVDSGTLEKLTSSLHHEGVALLIKKPPFSKLDQCLSKKGPQSLIVLGGVSNPHNIAAIIRSAAHFGISGIISLGAEVKLTPTLFRVSEGGAFFVSLFSVSNVIELKKIAQKYDFQLVAISSHAKNHLYQNKLPHRSFLLLGEEKEGLDQAALEASTLTVKIPGTDMVESLNVSVASALMMGEWYRSYRT